MVTVENCDDPTKPKTVERDLFFSIQSFRGTPSDPLLFNYITQKHFQNSFVPKRELFSHAPVTFNPPPPAASTVQLQPQFCVVLRCEQTLHQCATSEQASR